MTKLTIDDLVLAQQRTEAVLQQIAIALKASPKTTLQKAANASASLVSLVVWVVGAVVAYGGNLAGVCICMIAVTSIIERLLRR